MRNRFYKNRSLVTRFSWTAGTVTLLVAMVCNPGAVFEGASTGLKAWWTIVFPSLLPFFITSELLMSFGVVRSMGILLEPIMRPVFNVPGAGSFVLAIGYVSGYPIGAMVTARLRSEHLCTRIEAERLISFTNNSSPLFMLVAIPVGMFNNPQLGMIIAGSHYLASLTLGLLMRFHGRNDGEKIVSSSGGNILRRAVIELLNTLKQENRPLSHILRDAVKNSVHNLLIIGGFIILFAVIIRLLIDAGVIAMGSLVLGKILIPLGFAPEILPSLTSGLVEITIGAKMASESTATLLQQLMAIAAILGWSGLSVHAQVAGMITGTDIRMLPFIISRIIHACLAVVYTCFLYNLKPPAVETTTLVGVLEEWEFYSSILAYLKLCGLAFLLLLLVVLGISLLVYIFQNKKNYIY